MSGFEKEKKIDKERSDRKDERNLIHNYMEKKGELGPQDNHTEGQNGIHLKVSYSVSTLQFNPPPPTKT